MKKKGEVAIALALLGAASALCLKLMKKAGEWLDEDQRKAEKIWETEDAAWNEEEATEEDFAD